MGKLVPRITEAYLSEQITPEIIIAMVLLSVTIPESYGGLGASYVAFGLFAPEIARVDSRYRSMMSLQSSLVMYSIHAYGSEEQRKKYLPSVATDTLISWSN